jgi:hypothetical protein
VIRNIIDGSYLLSDNRAGPLVAITEAALNDHCAEHASALIQLERMLQAHFVACDAAELASELRAWFLDHAVNHDAHLKDIFQCRHERSIGGSDRGLLGNATKLGQRSHRP